MEVYKRVRDYVSKSTLDRKDIANKAGIDTKDFELMLSGNRPIYVDELRAICIALNVSPELFIRT